MCPQCNAPLEVHRFGLTTVCKYCGANIILSEAVILAKEFRKAYKVWNKPENYGILSYISLGESHWALNHKIAEGENNTVYSGLRARFPTELAIIKILHNPKGATQLKNEWDALSELKKSNAPGAEFFTRSIPQPIAHGKLTGSNFNGQLASIFRWRAGFHYNFEQVRHAYPNGIEPRASIWVWRRILETLSFLHANGWVHGAVTPAHLLVQENDHGIFLIGYGHATRNGNPQNDLSQSAKAVMHLLNLNQTPQPIVDVLERVASNRRVEDAWEIRDEIGSLADRIYTKPKFCPIPMP